MFRNQTLPTYYELSQARRSGRTDLTTLVTAQAAAGSSMIFYCDRTSSQLRNPEYITEDDTITSDHDYTLQANVYSFHSSSSDMKNLFKDNANNVQLQFQAQTQQSGEDYTWLINAGLSLVDQNGAVQNSVSLSKSPNQLTNIPAQQDQIVVQNGTVSLWFNLATQKTDGWWDKFLKAIGLIANSSLFAVVPMAKMTSQAVDAVTQMTQQIETTEKLNYIFNGYRLDCRIYGNDEMHPFVLRTGFWVIADYEEIQPFIDRGDDKENLKSNIILDIPGQQYLLVDKNSGHAPVDVTYAVVGLSLTAKAKTTT